MYINMSVVMHVIGQNVGCDEGQNNEHENIKYFLDGWRDICGQSQQQR